MAGTNVFAVKAKLVGDSNVLEALPGLAGVKVFYTLPAKDIPREMVFGGDVGGPVNLSAMKGGTRIRREERLTLDLLVRVYKPGQKDTQATDARAAAIAAVIAEYLAANPKLGGSVTDLKICQIDAVDFTGGVNDDGATTIATLTLGALSVLA